jgi:sorting nexin-29
LSAPSSSTCPVSDHLFYESEGVSGALALEKVVRDVGIQTNGTIFYKSVQLFAYADDTDIIARSPTALKEAFLSLERAAGVMGLKINEGERN